MSANIDIEAATESIWRHMQAGRHYPVEWGGRLDMRQGYEIQLGILRRRVAAGERHATASLYPRLYRRVVHRV